MPAGKSAAQACTAAIILAAGESARMGQPKQLLHYQGRSLLRIAIDAALAAGCEPVIVVLGAQATLIRRELTGLPVQELHNPHWRSGMGSSLATAIASLSGNDTAGAAAPAAIVMPCDQPLLDAQLLCRILGAHERSGKAIVVSGYANSFGPPVLFERALFAELAKLDPGQGARSVIARHPGKICRVAFPEGAQDIDTPAEYAQLCERAVSARYD